MRVILRFRSTAGSHRAEGFSLIEVLIAMVILSIGVLGVTGLQLMSKRNNQDSVQQIRAASLAQELVERMRANSSSDGLATYVFNSPSEVGPMESAPSQDCRTAASACDTEQMALHDLWVWQQGLAGADERIEEDNTGGLVNPRACITGPGGGSGLYTVTIAWRGGAAIPDSTAIGPDGAPISCGSNAVDEDGNPLYGDADEFRRTIVVPAYIAVR